MAHGSQLHVDNWLVSVAALRRCGESGDVTGADRGKHPLEGPGGNMVAFVDNDVTVAGHFFGGAVPAHHALEHGDIDPPGDLPLAAPDSADGLRIDIEKRRQLRYPLIEKRLAVYQHERVPGAFGDEQYPGHRFSHSRRRHQHAHVVRQQGVDGVRLQFRGRASESCLEHLPTLPPIFDLKRRIQGFKQLGRIVDASARQSKMAGEILRARDDARRGRRRQTRCLALVEFGILERREAFECGQHRRRQSGFFHEELLCQGRANASGKRLLQFPRFEHRSVRRS